MSRGFPENKIQYSTISVSSVTDTYPTHWSYLGRGGHMTVGTLNSYSVSSYDVNSPYSTIITSLYQIPAARREFGMIVSVVADTTPENNAVYILANEILGGQDDDITNNNNWIKFGYDESYTNATPMPEQVGGIEAGTTFSNKTNAQIWNDLLYVYQEPKFSDFVIDGAQQVVEIGTAAIPSGNNTFNWNTSNASNLDLVGEDIKIYGDDGSGVESDLVVTNTNTEDEEVNFVADVSRNTAGTKEWTITAKNTKGDSLSEAFSIQWTYRGYYGQSSIGLPTAAAHITGLQHSELGTTMAGKTFMKVSGAEYIYFCIHQNQDVVVFCDMSGQAIDLATSADNGAYQYVDSAGQHYAVLTDTFNGISQTYHIYRSKNIINGSIVVKMLETL